MTMTEAKALALVTEVVRERGYTNEPTPITREYCTDEALCRAIERLEATEARHAAELREQAERFSEAALLVDGDLEARGFAKTGPMRSRLAPFILPAPDPDPLVVAMADCGVDRFESWADQLHAALAARGYEVRKIGEAGE